MAVIGPVDVVVLDFRPDRDSPDELRSLHADGGPLAGGVIREIAGAIPPTTIIGVGVLGIVGIVDHVPDEIAVGSADHTGRPGGGNQIRGTFGVGRNTIRF